MSGIVVVAPMIVPAAWPVVVSAASAVLVAMGFSAVEETVRTIAEEKVNLETRTGVRQEVEIEVKNVEEVSSTIGREEEMVFRKEEIEVRISRDVRGRVRVCVSGEGHSKAELKELGENLAGKVIQQYVYNRLIEEMKKRTNMELVEQSIDDDENIHLKLRSWED